MATSIGYAVSRLIRQRSYAGGELKRAEKKLEQATAVLRSAQAQHRAAKKEMQAVLKQIAELDGEIEAQSAIDVGDIYARKATPKRHTRKWGRHLVEIIHVLRAAEGKLVTTTQVVAHMADLYGLPQTTAEERRFARKWVTAKLSYLARRGAVERHHDLAGNSPGLWRWSGI